MTKLTFQTLSTESPELKPALKIYVDTFQTESITSYNINFDHPKTAKQYYEAAQLMGRAFIIRGDDILVAKLQGDVVGLALIKKENLGTFFEMAQMLFPDIFKLLPLLIKINYRHLLTSGKAMRLSSPVEGNYVTLQIIAISPQYQGQGIGKQFITEIHERYENQSKGIYLYTVNHTNKEIYEHFGYELHEITSAKDLKVYHMVYNF